MAASRTPAQTIPEELRRQSFRIDEQYDNLNRMLGNLYGWLVQIGEDVKPYKPELERSINGLYHAIATYLGRSKEIYGNLATALANYANRTDSNLQGLATKVNDLSQAIADL